MEAILKSLNWASKEFVYSGGLISLAAVSIAIMPAMVLGARLTWAPIIIIYLSVFSGLLYNRYKERDLDLASNKERTIRLEKYFRFMSKIIFFSLLLASILLLSSESLLSFLFFLFFFLMLFVYTQYGKGLTRKILAFKNIGSALLMVLLAVFLSIYCQYLLEKPFIWLCVFIFLRMLVNGAFQDIKDMDGDRRQRLKTLPIVFGRKKTIIYCKIVSLISVIPLLFGVYFGHLPYFSLTLLLFIPYSFYYLRKSLDKRNFYLTNYVLADAEFILWIPLLLLGGALA